MFSELRRREFLKLAAAAPLAAQSNPIKLKAGTAKIDITPDRPRICASGDKPDPPAAYARLHSRVLTLFDGTRRIVIVNYDLNCLDVATPILRERVERELEIPPSYLVLLATHNHQGPIQIAADNFDYGRELAEKIFGAIREAIAREDGDAELLFGNGYGYFTRAQRSYPPDYELQLLKVMRGGKVAALLFNYPTHPQLGPRKLYGASHPGFAMEELEAKYPGAVAIYADACGGNQYTLAPEGTTDFLAACKARGHELAQAAAAVAEGKLQDVTGPIESRMQLVDLPLSDPIPYKEALDLARNVPMDIGLKAFPDPRRDTNWIRGLVQHYKDGVPFPKRISEYICTDEEFLVKQLDDAAQISVPVRRSAGRADWAFDFPGHSGRAVGADRHAYQGSAAAARAGDGIRLLRRAQSLHSDARECAPRPLSIASAACAVHLSGRLVAGGRR